MPAYLTKHRCKFPIRFPNAIREYRLKAGLTQERLARLLGKAVGTVSAWETGQKFPNPKDLFGLARELSTLTEALYFRLYRPESPRDSEDHSSPHPRVRS